jgi:hypothetical protein
MRQKVESSGRPLRPATDPLDQTDAEPPFELADLEADRRLGQVEPRRRRRKAAQLDDHGKSFELVEVDAAHEPKIYLWSVSIKQIFLINRIGVTIPS